jgi:hypothetical protein
MRSREVTLQGRKNTKRGPERTIRFLVTAHRVLTITHRDLATLMLKHSKVRLKLPSCLYVYLSVRPSEHTTRHLLGTKIPQKCIINTHSHSLRYCLLGTFIASWVFLNKRNTQQMSICKNFRSSVRPSVCLSVSNPGEYALYTYPLVRHSVLFGS